MSAGVTVIGVGCEIDRLFAGQRPALPVPGPPVRDDLRDLFDAIRGPLRRDEAVIVIVGDWVSDEARQGIRTVRSLLETDRVAVHVTDLPPLATGVLAALTAALAPLAPSAGALASALDALASELYVLAWAGSVAGLQHPSVSLLHHARSLLPRSAFGIGLQPESFVRPISRSPASIPLAICDHPLELLVAPADRADMAWMLDVVVPALGGVPVREVAPTMHGPQWWGTSRLVEAVGVPSSLEWLARATLAGPLGSCRWCGEKIFSAPCPFCGEAVLPRSVGQRAGSAAVATLAPPAKEHDRGT